jgi:hypothetical protein
MALPHGSNPTVDGIWFFSKSLTADDVTPTVVGQNIVPAGAKAVSVDARQNDANDWITLPFLADVAFGHQIIITCNAGGNFEMRTPASSNEKINNVDSDGTQEYLCTDTDVIFVTKMSGTAGWEAHGYTRLGAVVTAVIPD